MPDAPVEQRLLTTIMFTDMVGFSAVTHRDESLAVELLEEQQGLVRAAVVAHGGREVKTEGDGFMLAFPSALEAVRAALEIQAAVAERNAGQTPERQFRLRIGAHVGDVLTRGTDLIGDGVNLAARVEPLAEPGGICVTSAVADQVRGKLPEQLFSLGHPPLKNIDTPVEVFAVLAPGQPPPSRPRSKPAHRKALPVGLLLAGASLLAAVGLVALRSPEWRPGNSATGPVDVKSIRSLAVLPLQNLTGDPRQENFVAGLTDSLTTDLAHVGSIRVISHQSARQAYGDGKRRLADVSRELSVDSVLVGSVQRMGSRYVINAQLVHGPTDQHLWAEKFEQDARDLLQAQNDIVLAVAGRIKLRLTGEEKGRLAVRRRVDPEALARYYEGRAELNRGNEAGLRQAVRKFDAAVSRDPNLALAWAGLADAHASLSSLYVAPRQAMPKAEAAARRALDLDPQLAEAHAALGYLLAFYHWDRAAAERELDRAIQLNPNYATAYFNEALVLLTGRRFGEALARLRRAHELEPTSAKTSQFTEWALLLAGRYQEVLQQADHTLKLEPKSALSYSQRGLAHLYLGDTERALTDLEKGKRTETNSLTVTFYAYGLARAGQSARAERLVNDFLTENAGRYVCAYEVGTAYEGMGDRRRALAWMEKGHQERCDCLPWAGAEPWMEPMRKDPRFKAILARSGLEP